MIDKKYCLKERLQMNFSQKDNNLNELYCSNIVQIVSKSYQYFNQKRKRSNCWLQIKKQKQKQKQKQRAKIQDVAEVVSSNTFSSIQQVSEDNLKEFLVSILCLCIQTNDRNEKFVK
jgi:hypothetical protein